MTHTYLVDATGRYELPYCHRSSHHLSIDGEKLADKSTDKDICTSKTPAVFS